MIFYLRNSSESYFSGLGNEQASITKGAVKIKHAEVELNLVKLQIIFWHIRKQPPCSGCL
jgi:hypothetical protein